MESKNQKVKCPQDPYGQNDKSVKPAEADWFLKELDEVANIFASSLLMLKGRI